MGIWERGDRGQGEREREKDWRERRERVCVEEGDLAFMCLSLSISSSFLKQIFSKFEMSF